MMTTEDEAKGKRCPLKFTLFNDRCEGAECMAWRWIARPERVTASAGWSKGRMGVARMAGCIGSDVPDEDVSTNYQQTIPNPAPSRGYCGLAGKAKVL